MVVSNTHSFQQRIKYLRVQLYQSIFCYLKLEDELVFVVTRGELKKQNNGTARFKECKQLFEY
jgi:hypothetical protein